MFENSISWLCEKNNPSVRYYAKRDLLHEESEEERKTIGDSKIVRGILQKQFREGWWGKADTSLWDGHGTCWQLVLLSETGMSRNERIEKACEHIFSYQRASGAFSASKIKGERSALNPTKNMYCLTGRILGFLIDFGFEKDSRTQKTINWLLDNQENDGLFPCSAFRPNPKTAVQNCYMGATKPLAALAKIPKKRRTKRMNDYIEKTARTLLSMEVFIYKVKDEKRIAKRSWTRFSFPHFWNSDALDAMVALTEAGFNNAEGTKKARELIASKEKDGRWILEGTHKGWDWEDVGKPSKWITLGALKVLVGNT